MTRWLLVPGGELSLPGILAGLTLMAVGLMIFRRLPRIGMLICAIGTAVFGASMLPGATEAGQILIILLMLVPIVILIAYWDKWNRRGPHKTLRPANPGPSHRRPGGSAKTTFRRAA